MNVLRSLASNSWNVLEVGKAPELRSLDAVRQKRVPAVLGLPRFRDGFEPFPQTTQLPPSRAPRSSFTAATLQRDGFDSGFSARRAPVDLTGGRNVKPSTAASASPVRSPFSASLSDLASLMA